MDNTPSFLSFVCFAISVYIYFRRTYFHDKIFAEVNKQKEQAHLEDLKAGALEKPEKHQFFMSMRGFKIAQKLYLYSFAYPIVFAFITFILGGTGLSAVVFVIGVATWWKWQFIGGEQYQSFKAKHQPVKPKSTAFGSARFDDIPNKYSVIEANDQKYVFLGFYLLLPSNEKKHIVTIAPSRSGKGACLIIPNLLFPIHNSFVVLDIKGENAAVTARKQKEMGKDVVIIDPWGVQESIGAAHGIEPMGFNPLAILEGMSDEHIFEECTSIAELIAPMPKNVKDPYWVKRARVLIRGLLLHHVKTESPNNWSLLALYKAMRQSEVQFMALVMEGCDISLAADDLNQFRGKSPSEKEFGSILSSAQDATEFIRNVSKGGTSFNPKQINEKPTAVYICIPEKAIENNYQWLRLVIGLCVRSISENVKNKQVERTVFLLDEAHYLGDMPEIRKALATSATYGICIWQFYQDIGQVQAAYGDYWHSIMNVGVQQFYKINDLNTQKYVSELLGDHTLELTNTSTNADGGKSYSESITGARLLTPEQVGKVPDIITRIDSKNYLLRAEPYFEKNIIKDYDKNPLI